MRWWQQWQERRRKAWWDRWEREHRWDRLAQYNSEVSRGIQHTDAYRAEMRREQELFAEEQAEWVRRYNEAALR